MTVGKWFVLLACLMAVSLGCHTASSNVDAEGEPANDSAVTAASRDDGESGNATPVDPTSDLEAAPENQNAQLQESVLLKKALVDVATSQLQATDPEVTRQQVLVLVERSIEDLRNDMPDFLRVTAEVEAKLQEGQAVEGSAARIEQAEVFMREFGVSASRMVSTLLPRYKAGDLDPVRTELLAHLICADQKQTQKALSN